MIKKTITLIIIILMLVSCISITVYADNADAFYSDSIITLRAGGGGSGGSGGGGGGSSSGSSHNSGTGRQPTLFESIIQFIMMPFVLFSSSIIFYIKLTKRSRKSKKLMKQMMQSDNAWKYKDISSTVKESFIAIQTAWSDMDMSPASQYMSDELYDNFQTKLNWMAYRNQKNVLNNVQLLKALPVAVYDDCDDSRDYIWFYIKGKMVDYIIDTNTQLKVSGNTSATTFVEYWQFTRKENNWVLNKILQKNESEQIPFTE
ncbi:MAG: Tim44 domain-containing protein [Clostridia bacterium]|nr:Tim44 domain-containing protein [Clostridia bacterium]